MFMDLVKKHMRRVAVKEKNVARLNYFGTGQMC